MLDIQLMIESFEEDYCLTYDVPVFAISAISRAECLADSNRSVEFGNLIERPAAFAHRL